jgi:hypothetical protein
VCAHCHAAPYSCTHCVLTECIGLYLLIGNKQAAPLINLAPATGTCIEGATVVLTAASAAIPARSNLVYTWTVDAEAAPTTAVSTGATSSTFTYQCVTAGSYSIAVAAFGTGTATSTPTALVTVTNPPPVPVTVTLVGVGTGTAVAGAAAAGQLVKLTVPFTDASTAFTYSIDVDWSDGEVHGVQTVSKPAGSSTGTFELTHLYKPSTAAVKVYDVVVSITENASPAMASNPPTATDRITITKQVSSKLYDILSVCMHALAQSSIDYCNC